MTDPEQYSASPFWSALVATMLDSLWQRVVLVGAAWVRLRMSGTKSVQARRLSEA